MQKNSWVTELSDAVNLAFGSILRERSEKLSRNILLVSALALVLSLELIDLTELSFQGVKIDDVQQKGLLLAATALISYLLVQFMLSAAADWRVSRHNDLVLQAAVLHGRDKTVDEIDTHFQQFYAISEQIQKLIDQRETNIGKMPSEEFSEFCQNDGLDQLQKTQNNMLGVDFFTERLQYLVGLQKSNKRYRRLSFVLQILFVVLIGSITCALIWLDC